MASPSPQPGGASQTPERKGPWANRVLSSDIEHTPEYDEFMKKLAAYHEKRGTVLTAEPELGRKLLDLRKLYEKVTGLGGYDRVTEEKGAWRDLAQSYKLSSNNTNSGYLLKTIYYKNLAAFEISEFFGKEPPPKELLEDRSAAGGAIMTRTAEDFQAQSPKPETNGDRSMTPPAGERRSLRQAPAPRTFFSPDTTPQRHNPPRAAAAAANEQRHGLSSTNGVNGHFPQFQPSTLNAPIGVPVATPRNAPHEFVSRKRTFAEANGAARHAAYAEARGHSGATMMHRVVMSLKSGLSSEVDYALGTLVRASFEHADRFLVEYYPSLPELLFERLQSVEKLVHDFDIGNQKDSVEHAAYTKQLEKINEVALILRNMSFQPENSKAFDALHYPRDIIIMGLSLPDHPSLNELKHYLLDMVESLLSVTSSSFSRYAPLFNVLCPMLLSDDRGLLLGSLRTVCRLLIGREDYNRTDDISDAAISRIQYLLMLEDEELMSACLDFLYQYTTDERNAEKLLAPPNGTELVKHLVRLLVFQGLRGEQIVYLKSVRKPPASQRQIPQLPQEIVKDLLGYTEPERATKWMRCCFEEDPESDITQIALWQAYQQRFTEFVAQGLPLLPAAEFIKNVSVAFTSASAMVLPTVNQGQKFIIKGIRPRETPMNLKGIVYLACKWVEDPNDANSHCKSQVATPQDLWAHILEAHLKPPVDATQPQPLVCNWNGCNRFPPPGDTNRLHVVSHVRTHMPDRPKLHYPPVPAEPDMPDEPDSKVIIKRCETTRDERGEALGLPLTAALVLRNLCRTRLGSRELLTASKSDLYDAMAVNKSISPYVTDLLSEMAANGMDEGLGETEE